MHKSRVMDEPGKKKYFFGTHESKKKKGGRRGKNFRGFPATTGLVPGRFLVSMPQMNVKFLEIFFYLLSLICLHSSVASKFHRILGIQDIARLSVSKDGKFYYPEMGLPKKCIRLIWLHEAGPM